MISLADPTGMSFPLRVPLFGNATSINKGAAIMRGSTDGTNMGYGIVGATALTNFVGVTEEPFLAATLDNTPTTGTRYLQTTLICAPHGIWQADYQNTFATSGTDCLALTATTPSTAPTVSSGENIGGGWLLGNDGFLTYVESSSSGTYTVKTQPTAANNPAGAWTSATLVIKILPMFDPLLNLNTTADYIKGGTAAQGSWNVRVLRNFIRAVGYDNVELDPTKHSGINLWRTTASVNNSSTLVEIYAWVIFTQTIWDTAN